jgi:3-hydroxybutyryl-CoA dehydratase
MFDTRDVLPAEAVPAAVLAEVPVIEAVRRGTIPIEDLGVGLVRTLSKVISDREIEMFADVSSDYNPVHLDEDYAAATIFGGRIAHGMLTSALISAVIGEQLPGHGTIYLKQALTFLAPVRPGDRVEARVEVREIDHRRRRATLDCRCTVGDTVVLKGEALVLVPSRDGA